MINKLPAYISIGASVGVLLLLASLHVLSPELDPSWRMVSEYANGQYGWILSLMFVSWAISSWALAFAIWSQIKTRAGKIGLFFLIASGIGEAMASLFDINHGLHSLAALIGIGSLPIAAMLISISLGRNPKWLGAKKVLLRAANATWMSVVLMAITFAILIFTYTQSGGDMTAQAKVVTTLPDGVIALVGWANRLLVVVFCTWIVTTSWQSIKLQKGSS